MVMETSRTIHAGVQITLTVTEVKLLHRFLKEGLDFVADDTAEVEFVTNIYKELGVYLDGTDA